MIKRLKYIFIPVLAVFLMSHNVSALDFSVDYNAYERINIPENPNITCVSNSGTNANVASCDIPPSTSSYVQVNQIYAYQGLQNIKEGDLIEFYLKVNTTDENFLHVGDLNIQNFNTYYGSYYAIIGVEEVAGDDLIDLESYSDANGQQQISYIDIYNFYRSYKVFRFVLRVRQDTAAGVTAQYGLYSPNGIFRYNSLADYSIVNISIFGAKLLRYSGTEVNKEVEDKTQNAADNSSTAGDSSTSDSESATSSLLNVIGTGIGAITSATPSNCRINGNMGNLDVGTIDLCSNPVPSFVAVIGSIIAVLMVLPLVILLFNRFIGIIRSFQT